MTGYIVLGMGFGILLQKQGYGLLWAFLMSLCIYAGSMQYVTIDLLGSGALTTSDLAEIIKSQQFELTQLKKENQLLKSKILKAAAQGFKL